MPHTTSTGQHHGASMRSGSGQIRKELFGDSSQNVQEDPIVDTAYSSFPPLPATVQRIEPLLVSPASAPLDPVAPTLHVPDEDPPAFEVPNPLPRSNAWTTRSLLAINKFRRADNPYMESVDPDWGKSIPDLELQNVLEELSKINQDEDLEGAKHISWTEDDTITTKIRLAQLRSAAVIANTPESTHTRDEFERWLQSNLVARIRMEIIQLRVLGRHLFLLVLKDQKQRDRLLGVSDLSFEGFPVIFSPWTIDYNPRKANVRRIATWVELPNIDPVLEHLGNRMLSELGQPTFRTITKGVNCYTNMRGCVMMEEGSDRPTKLVFDLPWGGVATQEVKYQDVPNLCFKCKRPGHQARQCQFQNLPAPAPGLGGNRNRPEKDPVRPEHSGIKVPSDLPSSSVKEDGFIPVQRHKGKRPVTGAKSPPVHTPRSNLYAVLEVDPEGSGIPIQDLPSGVSPSPATSNHSSSQNFHTKQLAVVEASIVKDPPVDVQGGMLQLLGTWAEITDEDNNMVEASSRGIKGRPQAGDSDTPERGNTSKRRQTEQQHNISLLPRLQMAGFITQDASEGNESPLPTAEGVIPLDPDPGDGTQEYYLPASGEGSRILNLEEDRALGPTLFVENPLGNVGAQINLSSWNVQGLGNARKFKKVKEWTDKIDFSSTILALQETKQGGWKLQRKLQQILPGGQFLSATSSKGKARSILILHSSMKITSWGTCPKGYAVWAKLKVAEKELGIVGLHAPNKRKLRIDTWKWLTNHIQSGNWAVLGDFNQVDKLRDSVGPSPRIHGKEERIWRSLVFQRDMVDCFTAATVRAGPRFTRQARSGRRLDRSRLDRVYLTENAIWIDRILKVQHFGSQTAADHIPITACLQLDPNPALSQDEKKLNYFKLNAACLKRPGFKEECKRLWEDHPEDCSDPRKRWSQGWSRIKSFCKAQQKAKIEEDEIRFLQQQVNRRRTHLPADCSEEEIQDLTTLEDELRALENQEANLWVQRSKSKWLSQGEAPSAYFFSLTKNNFSRDRITGLHGKNGEFSHFQQDILQTIHEFYSELFDANPESLEGRLARQRIEDNVLTLRMAEEWSKLSVSREGSDKVVRWPLYCLFLAPSPLCGFSDGRKMQVDSKGFNFRVTSQFADNTSLFIKATAQDFQCARKVIELFEKASGASLNVQKSLIMALGAGRSGSGSWLRNSGCEVADIRRRFKYLGVCSGKEIAEKIAESIEKRLKSWVNRYLTFTSRLLLIKHVRTAIPSHHLMSVGLDRKGLLRINRSVRQFLWGSAETGKAKTSLISWDRLHNPKEKGGLGWSSLQARMTSFLSYNALRLLQSDKEPTNWMKLAHSIIQLHFSRGPKKHWSIQEIMLLSDGIRITKAPVLTRILSAWFLVKKALTLADGCVEIPSTAHTTSWRLSFLSRLTVYHTT
ncbi:hypothetical protein R1sor_017254 [Riccia sorocarpa]|uniref:CCHC-type domain-containing protein n=1 Tax=Riccia sorocarpa TaxID=122646 RepID=A0ABD3I926_9MARC